MLQIPMLVVDSDPSTRSHLVKLLDDFVFIDLIGEFDNVIAAYDVVVQARPFIVLVDLTDNVDLGLDTIEKIQNLNRNIVILASAEKADANLVIQAMRVGAREFLIKPIVRADLQKALARAKDVLKSDDDVVDGQIISVFSNKGGIGKTTLATNLALQLSEVTGEKVCIVDLNLQMGDVATFLDINPSFDIAYVVTHLSKLDESFLHSSLERYKNKDLYILSDPPDIEQGEEISADDINVLLNFLKTMFGYIIIDTSNNFDIKTLTCLDVSDQIFLVLMINLPSIRNAQKCLSLFKRLEYDKTKVKLIINRYIEDDEITVEDVEEALDNDIYWKVPNAYFPIMSSINKGIPVSQASPDLDISQNFVELAEKISGKMSSKKAKEKKEINSSLLHKFDVQTLVQKAKTLQENLKNIDSPIIKIILKNMNKQKQ